MSNYLIEAILLHRNRQVKTVDGLIYTCRHNDQWVDVTGYSLKQLKDYLNK